VLSFKEVIDDLKYDFEWQSAPRPLSKNDFNTMVYRALRLFFSDINRPDEYDKNLITTDDDGEYVYNRDFNINEFEYILILVKLTFAQKVQSQIDDMPSYSTDALKVTGVADVWKNLKTKIDDLQHERRIRFNKMVEHTLEL